MNKNDCEAAESIADSFLRMACVNCNFADASGKRTSDSGNVCYNKEDIRIKNSFASDIRTTVSVAG